MFVEGILSLRHQRYDRNHAGKRESVMNKFVFLQYEDSVYECVEIYPHYPKPDMILMFAQANGLTEGGEEVCRVGF